MAQIQAFSATSVLILLTLIQSTASNSIGFSLKLAAINSPDSPLYFKNISLSERLLRLIELSSISENMRLPLTFDRLLYAVEMKIGTPSIPIFLGMDTGSGLTWTQCEPCEHCYHQIPPIYDSRISNTYRQIPCNHPICRSKPRLFRCINEKCVYTEQYANGGLTRGILSEDIFEFLPSNRSSLVFGCSNYNLRFSVFETTGKIGGIMGFGFGRESIVQQLGNAINYRFSYCLVPFRQASSRTGFLRFGNDIATQGRSFRATPIVSPPGSSLYYLHLTGISVNRQRIGIPPGTFLMSRGGCIIDSGTAGTMLHQNAYQPVVRAFENYFAHFRLRRLPSPYRSMNLCYMYDSNFHAYASMTYHFREADLVVEPQHVYWFDGERIFCVPIGSSTNRSIIGALHQQNVRFIYDNHNRMLQFAPENCILDSS